MCALACGKTVSSRDSEYGQSAAPLSPLSDHREQLHVVDHRSCGETGSAVGSPRESYEAGTGNGVTSMSL